MKLVHLAPEKHARSIERAGISGERVAFPTDGGGRTELRAAIFAMPVVADYATTFQWTRELRRVHGARMIAIHFRIPDDEEVHVGRYGQPHRTMAAAASASWVEANPRGAEVIIARRIEANEVIAARVMDQRVGWMDSPESGGRVNCVCQVCLPRGDPKFMRRVRAAATKAADAVRGAATDDALAHALADFETPLERAADRIDTGPIFRHIGHRSADVRRRVTWLLGYIRHEPRAYEALVSMCSDSDPAVRKGAVESLTRVATLATVAEVLTRHADELVLELLSIARFVTSSVDLAAALELIAARGSRQVVDAVVDGALAAERDAADAVLRERFARLRSRVGDAR